MTDALPAPGTPEPVVGAPYAPSLGAVPLDADATRFTVWAPRARRVEVRVLGSRERILALEAGERGYHRGVVADAPPGTRYLYRLDGAPGRPDPASRHQPEGVAGPSAVVPVDPGPPEGGWRGLPLEDHVLYELHVGTFTPGGTFEAAVGELDRLVDLGITAVELMPVAEFPGRRNWGYDGVFPFAAEHSYGGPSGLRTLVDACHRRGLAVVLDVVHNHVGPEGCVLGAYAPYFSERYRTPWGPAFDLDGAGSDEVRRYLLESALHWLVEYGVDGLRLDAVHAIDDRSAFPFLEELAVAVEREAEARGRWMHLFPESPRNDPRLVRPRERGGLGLDAVWSDDLHHAIHAVLTGESGGYYRDFGGVEEVATALRDGFAFAGRRSEFRGRRRGRPAGDLPGSAFVVYAQNHDQVGNRARGERLPELAGWEGMKVAAAAVILSPFLPLLFMGEEYGETAPFLYFVDHSDPELLEAVRRGRRREFEAFGWEGPVPDPADPATYEASRIGTAMGEDGVGRSGAPGPEPTAAAYYRQLLRLRGLLRARGVLRPGSTDRRARLDPTGAVVVEHGAPAAETVAGADLLLLNPSSSGVATEVELAGGSWGVALDSAAERWGGPGSSLPDGIEGGGAVRLDLAPRSAVLLLPGDGDVNGDDVVSPPGTGRTERCEERERQPETRRSRKER